MPQQQFFQMPQQQDHQLIVEKSSNVISINTIDTNLTAPDDELPTSDSDLQTASVLSSPQRNQRIESFVSFDYPLVVIARNKDKESAYHGDTAVSPVKGLKKKQSKGAKNKTRSLDIQKPKMKVERNRGACDKHKRDRKRCPLDCKNRKVHL